MNLSFQEHAPLVVAPASKSEAQRYLLLAAIASTPTTIVCSSLCDDILRMANCLTSLGATVCYRNGRFSVMPISLKNLPDSVCLDCGESGAVLRFLLPFVAALGVNAEFSLHGRLAARPLDAIASVLLFGGVQLSGIGTSKLYLHGRLAPGDYTVDTSLSSQFLSGMLLSLPLLGSSSVTASDTPVSASYIDMTIAALETFGYQISQNPYRIVGCMDGTSVVTVSGDWSSAAALLAIGALSGGITVKGLCFDSPQGDKQIVDILRLFGASVTAGNDVITVYESALHGISLDCSDIPDLVPVLFALALCADSTSVFSHVDRLRLKESDRIKALSGLCQALGGKSEYRDGKLIVYPSLLHGGDVQTCGDHRIAMAAAVLSCRTDSPITIDDSDCIRKSYPTFFQDLRK